MATFAKATFNAASYATFRPTYPPQVYKKITSFHHGPSSLLLDLGCGHGLISREFAPFFTRVLGTDPSARMVEQAKSSTPSSLSNVSFRQASAEDLSFIEDGTLDLVVAGQAAHWFDYKKVWPELARKMRKGGTLAFWGYKDNYFVDYPGATRVMDAYCYGEKTMGPYWEQPGRQILRDLYKDIAVPEDQWEDVTRITYEPRMEGPSSGIGERLMHRRLTLGEMEGYTRTFSSFHAWAAAHQEQKARKDGGEGDIVDEMFDKMLEVEPEWRAKGENWRDFEVETEWGSVVLMARKR